MNVKTLGRCFDERIDKDLGKIVYTIEYRIQKAILTAIDSFITPKPDLAIRSKSAFSIRDATSVMASSERGQHIWITALLKTYAKGTTPYMC